LQARLDRSWTWEQCVRDVLAEVPGLLVRTGEGSRPRIVLERADPASDLLLATDYTASVTTEAARIALRVRSVMFLLYYGREFVLRGSLNTVSEATKILTDDRTAQYYLYAFADPEGRRFLQWLLLDLDRLRRCWSDPDRRARLGARQITFAPGHHGLAFDIDRLKEAHVVLRALLVTPTYYNLEQAQANLRGNRVYDALDEHDQRELARKFLTACYQSTYYQGPEPLHQP
jgi:hypothetical protein